MSRVAVIGAGISGLAASYLLSRRHDVLLFERDTRLGGHTHTHHLETPDGALALDTGFLVHNDRTYPLLNRLFDEIGVERLDSDMSFAVTCPDTGFEYSTRNLNGLFADRRNLVRPAHYHMLFEMLRFNRSARTLLSEPDADRISIGAWLDAHHFQGEFIDKYLFPLASAVWSASVDTLREFPAVTLVRFFDQHGMLSARDHPMWRVVRGGSAAYIPRLLASPRTTVHLGSAPRSVRRVENGVQLDFDTRASVIVDNAVFACHGDEVLPMLADATPPERDVISAFQTSANEAWLHTDSTFLPRHPAARASWNYLLGAGSAGATVTYHLNRLQRLDPARVRADYCVTLNPARPIAPAHVLAHMRYTHPLYTRAAIAAQGRWAEVSGRHRIHFAGAYWYYGFHEDGLRSAVRVADAMGVTW